MQTGCRPARAVQGRAMLRSVSMQQKQTSQVAGHEAGVIFKTAVSYALNDSRDWAGGWMAQKKSCIQKPVRHRRIRDAAKSCSAFSFVGFGGNNQCTVVVG